MPLAYWVSFEKRPIATLRFNTIPSSWTWFVGVSTMTVFRCADANCIDINRAINKQNFFIVVVVQINQRLPDWSVILLGFPYTEIRNVEPVLSLVPLVKALALPGLSKRATSKA